MWGCNVTVVPYNSTAGGDHGLAARTGLFLSNGPGNPEDVTPVIELVQAAARQAAHLRHLPGPSDDCAGLRRPDLQDEVRPPRRQPPGEESRDREDSKSPARTTATPWMSIRSRARGLTLTHVNLLDGTAEGVECAAGPGVHRAVPPRERAGPAGQRLSVREVHQT